MRIFALLAAVIVFSGVPLKAQEMPISTLAQQLSKKSLSSLPVAIAPAAFTVTGQDHYHRERYDYGEVPTLSPYDAEGRLLPDGIYEFELKSLPANIDSKSLPLSDTQRLLTRNTEKPTQVIRGSFEISGGSIVTVRQ